MLDRPGPFRQRTEPVQSERAPTLAFEFVADEVRGSGPQQQALGLHPAHHPRAPSAVVFEFHDGRPGANLPCGLQPFVGLGDARLPDQLRQDEPQEPSIGAPFTEPAQFARDGRAQCSAESTDKSENTRTRVERAKLPIHVHQLRPFATGDGRDLATSLLTDLAKVLKVTLEAAVIESVHALVGAEAKPLSCE